MLKLLLVGNFVLGASLASGQLRASSSVGAWPPTLCGGVRQHLHCCTNSRAIGSCISILYRQGHMALGTAHVGEMLDLLSIDVRDHTMCRIVS
jgi:hypothetical protein